MIIIFCKSFLRVCKVFGICLNQDFQDFQDFQDKTPALNRLATDKFVLSYNTYYRGLILVILKILKILVQTSENNYTHNLSQKLYTPLRKIKLENELLIWYN